MTSPAFPAAQLAPGQVEMVFTYSEQLAKLLSDRGLYAYVYQDRSLPCEVAARRTDVWPWIGLIVRVLPHPADGGLLLWHLRRTFVKPRWKQDPVTAGPHYYFQPLLPAEAVEPMAELIDHTLQLRLARRHAAAAGGSSSTKVTPANEHTVNPNKIITAGGDHVGEAPRS
jgi:hypothetical protein